MLHAVLSRFGKQCWFNSAALPPLRCGLAPRLKEEANQISQQVPQRCGRRWRPHYTQCVHLHSKCRLMTALRVQVQAGCLHSKCKCRVSAAPCPALRVQVQDTCKSCTCKCKCKCAKPRRAHEKWSEARRDSFDHFTSHKCTAPYKKKPITRVLSLSATRASLECNPLSAEDSEPLDCKCRLCLCTQSASAGFAPALKVQVQSECRLLACT